MANKTLFGSTRGNAMPMADTLNNAGGLAYRRQAEEALAQEGLRRASRGCGEPSGA